MTYPKLMRALALACAMSSSMGLIACNTTQTTGEQFDDALITTKVKSKLAADPEVSATDIDVDTNEGEVTLTGRVESESVRREAVKLARDTEGVERVRDLLKVGSE